jgi:hypothetical protein
MIKDVKFHIENRFYLTIKNKNIIKKREIKEEEKEKKDIIIKLLKPKTKRMWKIVVLKYKKLTRRV